MDKIGEDTNDTEEEANILVENAIRAKKVFHKFFLQSTLVIPPGRVPLNRV